jgi:hypothetical protein
MYLNEVKRLRHRERERERERERDTQRLTLKTEGRRSVDRKAAFVPCRGVCS